MTDLFYLTARKVGDFLSFEGKFIFPRSILRRLFRFAKAEVVVHDFDGNLTMNLNLSDHMQRRIFWMGYYSREIVALLKKTLKKDMVVLDVGANIGEITLVAANIVGEKGRVVSFEPVSTVTDRLCEHIASNKLEQVTVKRIGLGKKNQSQVPIYNSCGQVINEENVGLSSLYGDASVDRPVEFISVETLDESIKPMQLSRVDLIKIDIEGGEYDCLLGAENTLKQFQPMLIVEVQEFSAYKAGWKPEDLFEYLKKFGYEFFVIGKNGSLNPLNRTIPVEFENIFCKVREI